MRGIPLLQPRVILSCSMNATAPTTHPLDLLHAHLPMLAGRVGVRGGECGFHVRVLRKVTTKAHFPRGTRSDNTNTRQKVTPAVATGSGACGARQRRDAAQRRSAWRPRTVRHDARVEFALKRARDSRSAKDLFVDDNEVPRILALPNLVQLFNHPLEPR